MLRPQSFPEIVLPYAPPLVTPPPMSCPFPPPFGGEGGAPPNCSTSKQPLCMVHNLVPSALVSNAQEHGYGG